MKVQHDGRELTVEVTADGEGVVSHAGTAAASSTGAERESPVVTDGTQLSWDFGDDVQRLDSR